jgi:hypothetical protein
MPRKKKTARDMTDDELAKKVFGSKAAKELKKIANPDEPVKKSARKPSP